MQTNEIFVSAEGVEEQVVRSVSFVLTMTANGRFCSHLNAYERGSPSPLNGKFTPGTLFPEGMSREEALESWMANCTGLLLLMQRPDLIAKITAFILKTDPNNK